MSEKIANIQYPKFWIFLNCCLRPLLKIQDRRQNKETKKQGMSQDFYTVQQIQELVVVFLRALYHAVRLGNL